MATGATAGHDRRTIRTRLIGAFGLLFLLMLGITASAVVFVSYTRNRLLYLDTAANFLFEVEQARRYEKNYFLYGTGLTDAINSAHEAEIEIERSAAELDAVLGASRLATAKSHLDDYSSLLNELRRRALRATLLGRILESYDFVVESKGDLVIGRIKKMSQEAMVTRMRMIGRLIGYTPASSTSC